MIAIISLGYGNTRSLENALDELEIESVVTSNRQLIEKADKIIFPGVGEASYAMGRLKESGLEEPMKNCKKPVLGICLGMQLMSAHSEEGDSSCLSIFDSYAIRFKEKRVPQMGWTNVHLKKSSPLFEGIPDGSYFYFANSFYIPEGHFSTSVGRYGATEFSSSIEKNNFYGLQFHPEKSGALGLKILLNFWEKCK